MTLPETKKVDLLLADYALYHQTKGNVVCHFIGISMIVYGLLTFLLLLPVVQIFGIQITGAEILIVISMLYYFSLDVKLVLAMLVAITILDVTARAAALPGVGLALFVLGCIFQAIGHAVFEKNSPAFFKNLVHLMIGPLFLLNEVLDVRKPATIM